MQQALSVVVVAVAVSLWQRLLFSLWHTVLATIVAAAATTTRRTRLFQKRVVFVDAVVIAAIP